jgi:UDP-N-acetyl-D-mannosaminuronate dehydrogenase
MSTNVGIVGIGKMGLPVALSLLEHGFAVYGHRRHMIDDFITMGGAQAGEVEWVRLCHGRVLDVLHSKMQEDGSFAEMTPDDLQAMQVFLASHRTQQTLFDKRHPLTNGF